MAGSSLESLKNMIEERFSEENQELIFGFLEKTQMINLSVGRQKFYLNYLAMMGKHGWIDKSFDWMGKADVEKIVGKINSYVSKRTDKPYTYSTRRGYFICLKKLFQHIRGHDWNSDEVPEEVSWIFSRNSPVLRKGKDEETVTSEDILSEEEIFKMIRVCGNARDRCWLYLSYLSGWRPDEIHNLKLADVPLSTTDCVKRIQSHYSTAKKHLMFLEFGDKVERFSTSGKWNYWKIKN